MSSQGVGPTQPRRGRGATSNPANRFESQRSVPFDDGWSSADESPTPLKTTVSDDRARSIINYNASPDIPFDRSVNPYRGCEHGCIYCYARPSHAYIGLSPGLDFESRILRKSNAAALLRAELDRPGYACQPIALGVNTDAWQPAERNLGITRDILGVLLDYRHPVYTLSKSSLIERDADILATLSAEGLASVAISITTLDRRLARRLEPRAAAPQRRIETIRRLTDNGVPVGALVAPLVPVLTDGELESTLAAARDAGARWASYVMLRLPLEIAGLFKDWLAEHYPLKADHVMSIVRNVRAGRDNDAAFGRRMRGTGVFADLTARRFELARTRLGLAKAPDELDCSHFRPPRGGQLPLF